MLSLCGSVDIAFFSFLFCVRSGQFFFFKVGLCFYPPFVTCCTSRSTDRRRIDCFCCTCCHLFKFFQPWPLLHRPHLIAALFPSPRCFGQFSQFREFLCNIPASKSTCFSTCWHDKSNLYSLFTQNTFVDHSNRSYAVRLRKIWECTKVGHTLQTHTEGGRTFR